MSEYDSLNHTKWECKYHIVFIPKCRRKVFYGKIRRSLGEVFHFAKGNQEVPPRLKNILHDNLCQAI